MFTFGWELKKSCILSLAYKSCIGHHTQLWIKILVQNCSSKYHLLCREFCDCRLILFMFDWILILHFVRKKRSKCTEAKKFACDKQSKQTKLRNQYELNQSVISMGRRLSYDPNMISMCQILTYTMVPKGYIQQTNFKKATQTTNKTTFWVQITSLVTTQCVFFQFFKHQSDRLLSFQTRFLRHLGQTSDTFSFKIPHRAIFSVTVTSKCPIIFQFDSDRDYLLTILYIPLVFVEEIADNRWFIHMSIILIKNKELNMQFFKCFSISPSKLKLLACLNIAQTVSNHLIMKYTKL